jgi:pilus assembly protein CpaD
MTSPTLFRLVLLGSVVTLGACARPSDLVTGAIPDDYRSRHPIVVAEDTRDLEILVASSDTRLTLPDEKRLAEFARRFRAARAAAMRVEVPAGARNARAADLVARTAVAALQRNGVPRSRLVVTRVDGSGSDEILPLRFSFNAVTASVEGPCGQWPEDLGNTYENRNYHNFGCASQANLAAQIADPRDLLEPRGQEEIDAERRTTVIGKYRQGQRTGAQAPVTESDYSW